MYRASRDLFFPNSFSAIMCIALVTFSICLCCCFHIFITHYLVRCPAQYTSLFRDGIFDDSTWVYSVPPLFFSVTDLLLCSLRKLNTCHVGFQFPFILMPILTVATDSLPRFNARKQLREKLEEPLELKLPTNILFGDPESQNMLSNPFSTSASAETKYSEFAYPTRGACYWLKLSQKTMIFFNYDFIIFI